MSSEDVGEQAACFVPQAKTELALVSEARGCGFESHGARHLVYISNPRVDHGRMLVMLNILDWDKYHCFFLPVEDIDCRAVKVHVIMKLSGDPNYVVSASADMDIEEQDPKKLNLRNWRFA